MQKYHLPNFNLAMQEPHAVNMHGMNYKTTLNPYNLQTHAQQVVPSAHNAEPVSGPGHAPALSNLPANPSAIHPKNIVRNTFPTR